MKAHINENPVLQLDKRERSILDRWEEATKKIAEREGKTKDLKEIADEIVEMADASLAYA